MVTLADESADDDGSRSLLGDGMCVLAATLYALYTVALQKQLGEDDPDAPALFFGHIGIMTLAAGVPAIAAAQLLGWFRVQQLDPKAVALAGVNGGPTLRQRRLSCCLPAGLQDRLSLRCYAILHCPFASQHFKACKCSM